MNRVYAFICAKFVNMSIYVARKNIQNECLVTLAASIS